MGEVDEQDETDEDEEERADGSDVGAVEHEKAVGDQEREETENQVEEDFGTPPAMTQC